MISDLKLPLGVTKTPMCSYSETIFGFCGRNEDFLKENRRFERRICIFSIFGARSSIG